MASEIDTAYERTDMGRRYMTLVRSSKNVFNWLKLHRVMVKPLLNERRFPFNTRLVVPSPVTKLLQSGHFALLDDRSKC